MEQPTNFFPGVYFNIPVEIYHNDGAVSSSGFKALRDAPVEYWWRCAAINPNAEPWEKKKSMEESDRFHMLLLEPARFAAGYQVQPGNPFQPGKKIISQRDYAKLEYAVRLLRAKPRTNQLFSGGMIEVSFFVNVKVTLADGTEVLVLVSARPDYTKPRLIVDYKAHAFIEEHKVRNDITNWYYDVQAGVYTHVVDEAKRLLAAGEICAHNYCPDTDTFIPLTEEQEAFIAALKENAGVPSKFVFTFQRKEPPFRSKSKEVAQNLLEIGRAKMQEGIQIYAECLHRYGSDPWPDGEDSIEVLGVEDMPSRIMYN